MPANGDYFTTELVGEPLLVKRDSQGEIRVLANVCRHRGNLVATGRRNARLHVCGYHEWSYELSGKLKRAPLMQDCKDLDTERCTLPTIRTTIWQNVIFVNLDGDALHSARRLSRSIRIFASTIMKFVNSITVERMYGAPTGSAWLRTSWKATT